MRWLNTKTRQADEFFRNLNSLPFQPCLPSSSGSPLPLSHGSSLTFLLNLLLHNLTFAPPISLPKINLPAPKVSLGSHLLLAIFMTALAQINFILFEMIHLCIIQICVHMIHLCPYRMCPGHFHMLTVCGSHCLLSVLSQALPPHSRLAWCYAPNRSLFI